MIIIIPVAIVNGKYIIFASFEYSYEKSYSVIQTVLFKLITYPVGHSSKQDPSYL